MGSQRSEPKRWFFSTTVLALLSSEIKSAARRLVKTGTDAEVGVVVASAQDVLSRQTLPFWSRGPKTKYFLHLDVPESASILLPSEIGLRRPEQRLYFARSQTALRRLIIAQYRDRPFEGIVDAFVFLGDLAVFAGDLRLHRFPISDLSALSELKEDEVSQFEIDEDGSYLYWESRDIHLGVSELLKETDRDYLVELEIGRAQKDHIGRALVHMRAERQIRQSDFAGLSARQVRRLEKGDSQLTADSAQKLASSLGLQIEDFLAELSKLSFEITRFWEGDADRQEKEQTVA